MIGFRIIKNVLLSILAVYLIAVSAFADDTFTAGFNISIDSNLNTNIEQIELFGEVDNSELEVNVIKYVGETATLIYTGPLKGYEDGAWSYTDFSNSQTLAIFDWNTLGEEVIYIIPKDGVGTKIENLNSDDSVLSVEVSSNNSKYFIKQAIVKNSDEVIVHDCPTNGKLESVTLVKNTNDVVPAKLVVVLYNGNELENMEIVDIAGTESEGTEIVCDINLIFGTITEEHHVKIMVWDGFNNLSPLVDPYDTAIVTTDYIYSNTIQLTDQVDEYTFTVSKDAYYSIEYEGNDKLNVSLFHNNANNCIATSVDGTSIEHTLSASEVYILRITSEVNGLYTFKITQSEIPDDKSISVGVNNNGNISYADDFEQFIFTPTQDAVYDFYIHSQGFYPIVSILDSSNNEVAYEDNLLYEQKLSLVVELESDETYTVLVKSRKGYTGEFEIIARMLDVNLNSNGIVDITGKFNGNPNEQVGIIMLDPNGAVEYIMQTTSDTNGGISTTAKIDDSIQGTHTMVINTKDADHGMVYYLSNGGNVTKRDYEFWKDTSVSGLSATISYNKNRLVASTEITSTVEISNVSTEDKFVTVFNVLYDSLENVVEFSSVSDCIRANTTREIEKYKTMPDVITGYKWRTFVWLGNGNYRNSLRPICASKELNTTGISVNSLAEEINLENEIHTYTVREFSLNGQTKRLDTSQILNNINLNKDVMMLESNEEYNSEGVEYSYKIKHNGTYYSTIMPGTNEIEFYFKNTNQTEVSFVPYVWLVSINGETLEEKYIQLGDYITLAPGEGTTVPWVHSMVLDNDYNLQLIYGDVIDLLNYFDFKGVIRFIPYTGTITPIVFNKSKDRKFIYCNNPEAIFEEQLLSDNPTAAQLLFSEKGAGVGKYTLMAEHNNQLSEPITVDVQFFTANYDKMKITALGVQVPENVSWACAEAYSDYMQLNFAESSGYSVPSFYEVEFVLNNENSSKWLSDIYELIYDKSYPRIKAKDTYFYCEYIIMDFEILEGAADINIAAYRNKYNQSPYCEDGKYYWDRMHKGISDTAARVEANLFITLSDEVNDGTVIPVRVYNQYNPYGFQTSEWITNLNPQSDPYQNPDTGFSVRDMCAESDMIAFVYNDNKKADFYGDAVPEEKKDYNWHFDTMHGDNKLPVVSKTWIESGGYWQYITNSEIPSNHIPNDILNLSPYQSATDITSFDLACSLGNYSVETYYNMYVFNLGSNTRTFEYWLETNSNNMLLFYLPSQGYIESKCKGENNGKECIFSLEIDPGDFEHFLIMEVLPTGNSGGMRNSFRVTSN